MSALHAITKYISIVITIVLISLNPLGTQRASARTLVHRSDLPHLELDMDGFEYRDLIERSDLRLQQTNDPLRAVLAAGKRNLDWIELLNRSRPVGSKLELSTAATQKGIPIENPKKNNRETVMKRFDEARASMPKEFSNVIFGQGPLPAQLAVSDSEYLEAARELDGVYQSASRWLLMEPRLPAYAELEAFDIRGYYFLTREPNLIQKLQRFTKLSSEEQDRLGRWLVNLCQNFDMDTREYCRNELNVSLKQNGNAVPFYKEYLSAGKETYDDYFKLRNPRPEMVWNRQNPKVLRAPFLPHSSPEVGPWLVENIEGTWRLGNWGLKLEFRSSGPYPYITFIPGATAHVNKLGGDKIVMDANRSLDQYSSRVTISHEFGHVLGFEDCYVEFYDTEEKVMINYQIDLDNLMCSRKGSLQPQHVEVLRTHYFK